MPDNACKPASGGRSRSSTVSSAQASPNSQRARWRPCPVHGAGRAHGRRDLRFASCWRYGCVLGEWGFARRHIALGFPLAKILAHIPVVDDIIAGFSLIMGPLLFIELD